MNNPEYSYELKKTNSTLRDSVRQTDQLTCTVTCHTFNVTDLYCFLYNVVFLSTKIYSNFTYVTSDKHIKSEQWFQIKFNSHGVQKVLVHQTIDERVKNIIQDIVNQFNIGVEPMSNMSVGLFRNIFTVKENVPIGSCVTTYTLQTLLSPELVTFNSTGHPQENKDDGVIVYALPMHYGYQTGTYVLINKKRTNCSSSMEFFNGMDIVRTCIFFHMCFFNTAALLLQGIKKVNSFTSALVIIPLL